VGNGVAVGGAGVAVGGSGVSVGGAGVAVGDGGTGAGQAVAEAHDFAPVECIQARETTVFAALCLGLFRLTSIISL